MKTPLLFICLLLNVLLTNAQNLAINDILLEAKKMLLSEEFEIKIKTISPVIKNIQIAEIEYSYREFPSILIFKKDTIEEKWVRAFECLSPGIQDYRSDKLDLHTIGLGVDFSFGDDSLNVYHESFKIKELKKFQKDGILIPYQHFFHWHIVDKTNKSDFKSYSIDKTSYFDFANKLLNNKYFSYPKKECVMFDSPEIISISLSYIDNLYRIEVLTYNDQIWIYTFRDVDSNFEFLLEKKIIVEKSNHRDKEKVLEIIERNKN